MQSYLNPFWSETMKTTVSMINLSPSVPIDFDVTDKVWKQKDVFYVYLRVFGCKAFVHGFRDGRYKLDNKTKQCVFQGFEDDEFGYRLRVHKESTIVRCRDFVLFKDQTTKGFE